MRRFVFAIVAILLMFSLVACGSTSDLPNTEGNSLTESGMSDTEHTKTENGGAAIILNMNGTDIHARLYDNVAAKAFLDLLPHTVTVSRAADDLCGSVSGQLARDPAEDQDTWAIGEIGWFDGWFTILCDNEEGMPKRTRTIIGKVVEEDIPVMQSFTGSVKITVTLDESFTDPTTGEANAPKVYFTSDVSPEGLMTVYEALGWEPAGKVAVKISTGEPPASNYLRPELIKDLVQAVEGTIVECNTAYGGSRAQTAMHYQVAKDHGFTDIADFQILDEKGSMTLEVIGGSVLKENYVGAAFADYDSYLILSHFKGHAMAGYGGAIKNISIGLGSSEGKGWIHSGGKSKTSIWGGDQDDFLEAMAEAGKSVSDYLGSGERIVYVNVMNRLSVDCDCDGSPAEPDMHDIGILASTDPVALDQACIDLIYAQKDGDGASLIRRIESRNGLHTLEHAEKIGLGSRVYELVNLEAASAAGDVNPVEHSENGSKTEETGMTEHASVTEDTSMKMNVQVGDATFTATLEDNVATRELLEMMKEEPITINMSDYAGFEKVGPLGRSLTTENHQTTTAAGDIVLYNGNQIVMFYGSNSWSYTRIGKIDDLTGWKDALGGGSITAVFSLAEY